MEALVTNFIDVYGEESYLNIKDFLEKNSLIEEFQQNLLKEEDLFVFAFNYGIFDLFVYLYEIRKISFCFDLIPKHFHCEEKNVPIIIDIYTAGKYRCIDYFLKQRRYSKMFCKNGKFYYVYNKR